MQWLCCWLLPGLAYRATSGTLRLAGVPVVSGIQWRAVIPAPYRSTRALLTLFGAVVTELVKAMPV